MFFLRFLFFWGGEEDVKWGTQNDKRFTFFIQRLYDKYQTELTADEDGSVCLKIVSKASQKVDSISLDKNFKDKIISVLHSDKILTSSSRKFVYIRNVRHYKQCFGR